MLLKLKFSSVGKISCEKPKTCNSVRKDQPKLRIYNV